MSILSSEQDKPPEEQVSFVDDELAQIMIPGFQKTQVESIPQLKVKGCWTWPEMNSKVELGNMLSGKRLQVNHQHCALAIRALMLKANFPRQALPPNVKRPLVTYAKPQNRMTAQTSDASFVYLKQELIKMHLEKDRLYEKGQEESKASRAAIRDVQAEMSTIRAQIA